MPSRSQRSRCTGRAGSRQPSRPCAGQHVWGVYRADLRPHRASPAAAGCRSQELAHGDSAALPRMRSAVFARDRGYHRNPCPATWRTRAKRIQPLGVSLACHRIRHGGSCQASYPPPGPRGDATRAGSLKSLLMRFDTPPTWTRHILSLLCRIFRRPWWWGNGIRGSRIAARRILS